MMLILALLLCFVSCDEQEANTSETEQSTEAPEGSNTSESEQKTEHTEIPAKGFWKTATYRKDTTVGEGSKTVKVDVEIDNKSITITLKTNEKKLGDALYKAKLINDANFFDTLNGIELDWDTYKAYWGFYEGTTYMMVGVNETEISGGEHYRFVYTK